MSVSARIDAGASQEHHMMLGMRLDYLSTEAFVAEFVHLAENGTSVYCCVPDVSQCMRCHDDFEHRAIVNSADFVISDSVILQKARALRYGVPALPTLLGSRLMLSLCRQAELRGVPIGLIGGRDDAVLAAIASALRRRFRRLRIGYAYAPPFRELEEEEERVMLEDIAAGGVRLLFIGIGSPKQERFMGRYHKRVGAAMIGVGAAFDTIGGRVAPSPEYVHRLGFEWLYRVAREPRRLIPRYLGTAPRFVLYMFADWFRASLLRRG